MIYYGCPKCEAAMASPDSLAGGIDTCPACGNVARVPSGDSQSPDPQGPSSRTPAGAQPVLPVASAGERFDPPNLGRLVTIERTSKRLKRNMLMGWCAIIGGLVGLLLIGGRMTDGPGPLLAMLAVSALLAGIIVVVVTRVHIWWRHG